MSKPAQRPIGLLKGQIEIAHDFDDELLLLPERPKLALKTLGDWAVLSCVVFGDESAATKFIHNKISEQGEDQEILADKRQFLHLLTGIHHKG